MPEPAPAPRDARTASFLEHRAGLLRYLRARGCGAEAEDILQEIWLKLSGAAADISAPRAYLYRSAHNLMLDRARERRRRASREEGFQQIGGMDRRLSEAPGADLSLIARQRLRLIDRTLLALGPKTNAIFREFRIEKISQQEIAHGRGISLSAVEKLLQKAYKALAAVQRGFQAEDAGMAVADADDAE